MWACNEETGRERHLTLLTFIQSCYKQGNSNIPRICSACIPMKSRRSRKIRNRSHCNERLGWMKANEPVWSVSFVPMDLPTLEACHCLIIQRQCIAWRIHQSRSLRETDSTGHFSQSGRNFVLSRDGPLVDTVVFECGCVNLFLNAGASMMEVGGDAWIGGGTGKTAFRPSSGWNK